MSDHRVLVAIPYHDHYRYCLNHLMDWVNNANLGSADVVLRVHRGQFGEKDAVKNQREYFRELALDNDHTHLFFVGCDTIPPLNALEKLMSHNTPIVRGLYFGKSKDSGPVPGMDCILFEREVLELINWLDNPLPDDDYPIYERLKELGYEVTQDDSVRCRHYVSSDLWY